MTMERVSGARFIWPTFQSPKTIIQSLCNARRSLYRSLYQREPDILALMTPEHRCFTIKF